MERKFEFSIGEFYHLYNRGNNKQTIFLKNRDKERFVHLLYLCNSKKPVDYKLIKNSGIFTHQKESPLVDIGLYCLMPNHFHMLVREAQDGGISKFMQKLTTAYSMYFNKLYEKTGSLFEGKFKAQHINNDRHFQYLFAYIHLNPVKLIEKNWKDIGITDKQKAKDYLLHYTHSSYIDYIGIPRKEGHILNRDAFPFSFSNTKEFEEYIDDVLQGPTL